MFELGKSDCAGLGAIWYHGDQSILKSIPDPLPDSYATYFAEDPQLASDYGKYLHRVRIEKACVMDADEINFAKFLDKADKISEKYKHWSEWAEFATTLRSSWMSEMEEAGDKAGALIFSVNNAGDNTSNKLVQEFFKKIGYDGFVFEREGTRELVLMDHKKVVVLEAEEIRV